jgi:hypothetical protein
LQKDFSFVPIGVSIDEEDGHHVVFHDKRIRVYIAAPVLLLRMDFHSIPH